LSKQEAQLFTAFKNEQDPVKKQAYSDALGQTTKQISELKDVQTQIAGAITARLNENFAAVDDKTMQGIRDFFTPSKGIFFKEAQPADFSETKKKEFESKYGSILTKDVANWLFDTIKKNTEAAASLHGSKVPDARFYFDAHVGPAGEQIPAANRNNMANDVVRYIMGNFGVTSLMDHA
jgi:hypothetical protein